MFLVSKTFVRATPESASRGEAIESGYTYESEPMTLRETLDAIAEIPSPEYSSFPDTIYSDDPRIIEYGTLTIESVALHIEANDRAIHWLTKCLHL